MLILPFPLLAYPSVDLLRFKVIPVGVLVGLAGIFLYQDLLSGISGTISLMIRLQYWRSGVSAVLHHPDLGMPRSVFLDELGYDIIWNPRNSVLWTAANFGLLGVAAYTFHVAVALVEIGRALPSRDCGPAFSWAS